MTSPEFLPLAFDALLKTTLVLAAAGGTALLLKRRAASWRHLAWSTALAGALAMPAVAWFAPEWTVPVDLPLPLRASAPASAALAAPVLGSLETGVASAELMATAVTVDKLPPSATGALAASAPAGAPINLVTFILAAWGLGSALLLAWTVRAHLRAHALVRRARPIGDPELELLLASTPAGARVRLVESTEIDVPLATGLRNPALVVPAGFSEWSVERRRIVLLHELAHVERGDCLALSVARAAVALWWFHPAAWFALARLRREAEQAADDRVLESGTRPSDYAAHLLAVVRSLTGRDGAIAGLSMAGSSVERRLLALLDPARSRRRMSPAALALCTVAVAGGVVALGGLRAGAAPTNPEDAASLHEHEHAHQQPWTSSLAGNELGGSGLFDVAKRLVGHPASSEAFDSAMTEHRAGRYEASAEGFMDSFEQGYARGTSAFNVACALSRLGRDREAVEWLERAFDEGFDDYGMLETDEDLAFIRDSPRFRSLADSTRERADLRDRKPAEKHLFQLDRRLKEVLSPEGAAGADAYALGYELHGEEDWQGAEKAWRKAAELGHSPANSHYNVACALARQGRDREAMTWLQKAVGLGFDDVSNLDRDEDLASLRGRRDFTELREGIDALEAPGDINDLDEIRNNQADWIAFTERTGQLARRHPEMGKAWLQHGMGLLRTERFGEAAAAFRKAAETGQPEGLCLWNEACALAGGGNRDQAVDALRRSLALGFGSGWDLTHDPDLAALEGHAGFEELKREHPAKRGEGRGPLEWLKDKLPAEGRQTH